MPIPNNNDVIAEPKPTIMRGSTGTYVLTLQAILTRLGYLPPGAIDGTFGTQTEYAVKSFQATWGLIIDGIVGPETWVALDRAEAGESPPVNGGIVEWIKAHKVLTGTLVGLGILGIYLVVKKK